MSSTVLASARCVRFDLENTLPTKKHFFGSRGCLTLLETITFYHRVEGSSPSALTQEINNLARFREPWKNPMLADRLRT
jgi:hypothetical protein